ncbi:MAG TPA: helix-turn-helix domain-containing protein [Pseudonocardia sp.]|jgi:DNA-binding IclR family transcriptional regulator|uniref:IclR family transcriptional regulator n=1 Tax=Pseudonocardia sp. TaxID=60912 RepID=UPI002B4B4FA8|nr:helix-turn-helix domain-containing protein [Pseudonocardia sp.]HLU58069.1 helix-turn-helix domain-containing protein [Pseudonocardia sp.]
MHGEANAEPVDRDGDFAPAAEADRGPIQSIERAAKVLSLFDGDTPALTAATVSERLGLNRTTAHRYLQALQSSGFLGSGYGPGPLLDQLAAVISGRQQILTLAPAIMRDLSDRTGLTVVLSFLGRSGAVVTLVEEASAGTVVLTVRVGTVLELKAAQTRVLLAFQSDPAVVSRMLARLAPEEAVRERAQLASVRRDRLAWADLGQVGLASVAAPIFGRSDIGAAMAMIGTTATLSPGQRSGEPVDSLRQAAEKLSSLVSP